MATVTKRKRPSHQETKSSKRKTRVSAPSQKSKARPKMPLSDTLVLERLVFRQHTFLPIDEWRSLMERRQSALCQIRIHGKPAGTGFLVASDVVMTNSHVLNDPPNARRMCSGTDVSIVFDVHDGKPTKKENIHSLAPDCIVESSSQDDLDYTLLRLEKNPARAWIKPVSHQFETSEPLIIIQHPGGAGLKIALGPFSQLLDHNRVAYLVNTEPGSSGSPCFTTDWQLVALHRGTEWKEPHNLGIPTSSILAASKFDWPDEPIPAPAPAEVVIAERQPDLAEPLNLFTPIVRFVLKKGSPIWRKDLNGWLFKLSLEPKPADPEIKVNHSLRDYWGEGRHEALSANWKTGFQADFSSYGDLSIVSTIKSRGKVLKIQTWLSESLRMAHASEWNTAIRNAIEDLRQY